MGAGKELKRRVRQWLVPKQGRTPLRRSFDCPGPELLSAGRHEREGTGSSNGSKHNGSSAVASDGIGQRTNSDFEPLW